MLKDFKRNEVDRLRNHLIEITFYNIILILPRNSIGKRYLKFIISSEKSFEKEFKMKELKKWRMLGKLKKH